MTLWNTGYFLIIKKWWMGVIILLVIGLAMWGLLELLRRFFRRFPSGGRTGATFQGSNSSIRLMG